MQVMFLNRLLLWYYIDFIKITQVKQPRIFHRHQYSSACIAARPGQNMPPEALKEDAFHGC